MGGLVHRLVAIFNGVHNDMPVPSGPVRKAVTSCVHKSFSDDQFQTAYLLQECVMVRDGLAKLPDCFTVGDMCDIASYVSTC